ncbi:MAG: prepilin-type N-terminal cleavage/methylation domain-containing protein [Phycisphaeraceae bacterium]|nr:MAG: prepilin-type N-terminal cleavage/methylation domain-containing protein [Phycisphaeraceae bacterium]
MRKGFSLVEVLIGVLVLGLSLLGLAAVFPAIVREQRISRETIVGKSIERSAETYLRNRGGLNRPDRLGGWSRLSATLGRRQDGRQWSASLGPWTNGNYQPSGRIQIPLALDLAVAERLWPLPDRNGQGDDPQFVWDLAVCAINDPDTNAEDTTVAIGPLRVALFVRRIDPQIRVPRGQTLAGVLTDDSDAIVPVAADASTGEATLAGLWTGGATRYSAPITADVTGVLRSRNNGPYDTLALAPTGNGLQGSVRLARQIGQKLVDNLGTVYTVTGVPEGQPGRVVVEPPVSALVIKDVQSGQPLRRVQVVFTPQIPASATVLQINP